MGASGFCALDGYGTIQEKITRLITGKDVVSQLFVFWSVCRAAHECASTIGLIIEAADSFRRHGLDIFNSVLAA